MKHFLDEKLKKAAGQSAPFFNPKSADTGGIYSGESGGSKQGSAFGPRGGHIKGMSPSGKPVYFKPWESGQGYNTHEVIDPSAGQSPSGDYDTYQQGSMIGRTGSGKPIHSQSNINNTKNFLYDDHADAHHAHFTMAQYIKNLAQKRQAEGGDTSKLNGLYDAHMGFSRHHKEQMILDLLHGKAQARPEKDLGKEYEKSGKTIVPMRNIPGSRVSRVTR